jgi:hypothetical protein
MFRVSLENATAKRTCKPLYEQHQATPVATFLDADEAGDIYSGMVMTKTGPDEYSVCDGATQQPFGLAALDKNDVIDDITGIGLNVFAVWQGGPDAYFIVDAPAFDDAQTYTVPTDGTRVPLYAGTGGAKGKLTPADPGAGLAVAELIEVVSAGRIIVRLFSPQLGA